MASDLFPVFAAVPVPRHLAQGQPTRLWAQAEGGFDFEATPTLTPKSDVSPPAQRPLLSETVAIGLSVTLGVALVGASAGGAHRLVRRVRHAAPSAPGAAVSGPVGERLAPSWHALALLVLVFLASNVAFGGLTAWLLTGHPEDATAYFENLSALKLARLSHEHMFGYGLLFGVTSALGLLFVGHRRRVLFPCFLVFGAAALDTASWWLSRFVSPGFHTLSFLTGGLFALGFAVLFVQIARANAKGLGLLASALVAAVLGAAGVSSPAWAQDLDFDAPAVEPKKDLAIPTQVGPLSNITLGGAIDWRVTHVNGQKRPVAFIHVNELVVGANVGNHIAISAEQLLLTSETGTVVGQDHGFVTVSLVQLPFLPSGMSVKLGRFRGKFGLDAQMDSPANIFPSQVVRSNGFITDVGVNLDYAFGDFEAIVEVFNGPDFRTSRNGGSSDKEAMLVEKMPVQARFVYQPSSNVKLGVSGLIGETWDNQISPAEFDMSMLGSRLDRTRTIERRRVAADVVWRTSVAEFFGEGIFGHDKGRLAQAPDKSHTVAKGALGRVDVPLFAINDETRTKWAVQYDTWQDASYDGRVAFLSTAFSVLNDEGWTVRLGGSASDVVFQKKRPSTIEQAPWSATTQLLVTF